MKTICGIHVLKLFGASEWTFFVKHFKACDAKHYI